SSSSRASRAITSQSSVFRFFRFSTNSGISEPLMADQGKKAFVIGHPVAHSRSPMIHGYWLKQYGFPGSYERIEVHPMQVEAFLSSLPASGYAGGNVTIPHKEAAFGAADVVDEAAELIGAANTLRSEEHTSELQSRENLVCRLL